MITPSYGCSQPDLYSACRLAWKLCQKNLAAFVIFSLQYSEAFIAAHFVAVDAADFMLDFPARKALAKSAREDLDEAKRELVYQYGLLTAYIKKAFDASKAPLMLVESGEGYLAKARDKGGWSSASSLINSALPFLDKYAAVLSSENIMPPAFIVTFRAVAKDFNDKNTVSQDANDAIGEGGDAKVIANNALYLSVRAMLEDAQKIFRKNPDLAKQFVWSTLVAQTHGVKNAGFAGKITDADNPKLGVVATITVKNSDKTAISDSDGRYELGPLSMGDYSVTITAVGYETMTVEIAINTGVTARLNVNLKKVVVSGLLKV